MPQIVQGAIAKKKFVTLCTNALLMEKKLDHYKPSPYFNWSVHLDGDESMHDKSVCQTGVYDKAVAAIKAAKAKGFRVNINTTLFNGTDPEKAARFFDTVTEMGIDGITVSPGYAYERAPDQQHFLNRAKTKELFRGIFARGKGGKAWPWFQSPLFSRLPGRESDLQLHLRGAIRPIRCSGWQKPCYLLGEGYAKTFAALMNETEWEKYGTGNYEKCADCMVHCGFEATAVKDAVKAPWKMLTLALKGIKTEGPMAPEISPRKPAACRFRLLSARPNQKWTRSIRSKKTTGKSFKAGFGRPHRAAGSCRVVNRPFQDERRDQQAGLYRSLVGSSSY